MTKSEGHDITIEELILYLRSFLTPQRDLLLKEKLTLRTSYITVALEDIFQPQNASAILRTCDALGIQYVYVIEKRNRYILNPDVTLGAEKWITLYTYRPSVYVNPTSSCIRDLKKQGYRVVALSPHVDSLLLTDFPIEQQKTALLLGKEKEGLSEEAMAEADAWMRIPMVGFTESYNVSVAAAIALFYLRTRLEKSGLPFLLDNEERQKILFQWLCRTIPMADQLIHEYKRRRNPQHR